MNFGGIRIFRLQQKVLFIVGFKGFEFVNLFVLGRIRFEILRIYLINVYLVFKCNKYFCGVEDIAEVRVRQKVIFEMKYILVGEGGRKQLLNKILLVYVGEIKLG